MRSAILVSIATVLALVGSSATSGGADFTAGEWASPQSKGIVRAVIRKDGERWKIQFWGDCTPNPCDWREVELRMLRTGDERAALGFAHFNPIEGIDVYSTVRFDVSTFSPRTLHIETVTVFSDGTDRDDYIVDDLKLVAASQQSK